MMRSNDDGTTRIDKAVQGGGAVFVAPTPIGTINAAGPDGSERPVPDAAISVQAVHRRGDTRRDILLALGGSDGSAFWIGTPDEAEVIVRNLQFCIGRGRALMSGGGVA